MPTQKILQNTSFNFKLTDEKGEKGYAWCQDLHMSFQNKDGGRTDWTCFKGKIESQICGDRDRGQRQKCPDSVCKE